MKYFLFFLLVCPSVFGCYDVNAETISAEFQRANTPPFAPAPPPVTIFGLAADAPFVLYEGSATYYDGVILAFPQIDALTGDTRADIRVYDDEVLIGSVLVPFDAATIDAYTSSETGESNQYSDVVIQAVKDYLEGITENSSVTFVLFLS